MDDVKAGEEYVYDAKAAPTWIVTVVRVHEDRVAYSWLLDSGTSKELKVDTISSSEFLGLFIKMDAADGWYLTMHNEANADHVGNTRMELFYKKGDEWYEHTRCHEDDRVTGYVNKNVKIMQRVGI